MKKPIIFFDLETTGVDLANDRIVQFAALKVTSKSYNDGESFLKEGRFNTEELKFYVNPGRPIPAESTAIHGITDEMVKDCPMFNVQAPKVKAFFEGCDLSGFNIKRFDIPLLAEEFGRAGFNFSLDGVNVIDPFILYKILNPQSLSAAFKKYTGAELEGAHDAMNDVYASFKVLQGMIDEEHVPSTTEELLKFQMGGQEFDPTCDFAGKFVKDKDGNVLLTFGKHRGEKATDHLDFLFWMLNKDFTRDTILWAQDIIDNPEKF